MVVQGMLLQREVVEVQREKQMVAMEMGMVLFVQEQVKDAEDKLFKIIDSGFYRCSRGSVTGKGRAFFIQIIAEIHFLVHI